MTAKYKGCEITGSAEEVVQVLLKLLEEKKIEYIPYIQYQPTTVPTITWTDPQTDPFNPWKVTCKQLDNTATTTSSVTVYN